jgi:hypothetical protein
MNSGRVKKGNKIAFKHGACGTPEHTSWTLMKVRCLNPDNALYPYYGGRGITIYPPWLKSFQLFLDHVGKRPTIKHTLERIENNGNYEPGNVRWATRKDQANNRRSNTWLTANGLTLTLKQWCERLEGTGLTRRVIMRRIKNGWTEQDALMTPRERVIV